MINKIIHIVIAMCLILAISACGDYGSTITTSRTQNNTQVALEVDKSVVVADGTDGITLTVTVTDSSGFPLAQQEVSFNVPLSLALSYPPPTPLITDENGQVILFLSPLGPDAITLLNQYPINIRQGDITATCQGVTSSPIAITVNPKPPIITSSVTLVADKIQAIAGGQDAITFTATVKDANGAPIPYQQIKFNVPPMVNRYLSPGFTDANGHAVIHLTCPLPSLLNGTLVLAVTATSGLITSNQVTVSYTHPLQAIPALVTLSSDKSTLIADGNDKVIFTITAMDSSGLPLAGQVYTLNVPPGPYMNLNQILTNTAGQAFTMLHSVLIQPEITNPYVIAVSATIKGTTSNAIEITITPP